MQQLAQVYICIQHFTSNLIKLIVGNVTMVSDQSFNLPPQFSHRWVPYMKRLSFSEFLKNFLFEIEACHRQYVHCYFRPNVSKVCVV